MTNEKPELRPDPKTRVIADFLRATSAHLREIGSLAELFEQGKIDAAAIALYRSSRNLLIAFRETFAANGFSEMVDELDSALADFPEDPWELERPAR